MLRLLSDNSGFGKIYEAYAQSTPKILKVLKEHLNNQSKAVELFQQEAAVLGQLHHPGIPKVDDYFQFQTKNGLLLHCIIMEKVDGPNLEQWLQQQGNQPISPQQAIAWLKQLANILHLVHGKQWFHRDIKPPNIMLRPNGQLVLIDFGTAREATYTYLAKLGVGNYITAVVSTGYTPPEQANGQALPQSDFFALGRTFVHLLTGQHPLQFYDAHNDVFRWRQAATISPLLADFLDQLMAQKPGDRPLNTQVLLQRIEEIEQKLSQRPNNKFPVALAAGVLLALGGWFGYLASKLTQTDAIATQKSTPATIQNPLENLSVANTLPDHSDSVFSVAISADGQTLVSGSSDKAIKIWQLPTGKIIRTLSGHSNWVSSVAISADGQTLVSASGDKTIKIWQLATGELIRSLYGHYNTVWSVAISPDGQTLVSGSGDHTIKIWRSSP